MVGPTVRGDPDDTTVAPVPLTLLGAMVILFGAAVGSGLYVVGALTDGALGTAGSWVVVGGVVLGGGLICWDKLTEYFAAAPPPGRDPDFDGDEEALGDPVDDVGDAGPD